MSELSITDWQINDIVICVKAKPIRQLTLNKVYRVKKTTDSSIYIINDDGEEQPYFRFRFKKANFSIFIKQLFDFV